MSIRSTSNMSPVRREQPRPARRVEQDGPSFTEVVHSRLFSNYVPPRGEAHRIV
ncbi:hypothetical protein [Rhodococcus sp. BL-253-APC-6A1W]|uniref:hypothetical protein n=1 Tax=Rhodococcus sp. BL-253-APC-6A1W TaxID=2725307 RepID=UPI00146A7FD0|nr:hypothetical protein [Rhodococcus sp. BL-253-APC-6A1W]